MVFAGGIQMTTRYVLTDYVGEALGLAVYEKMEDGSYAGRIPGFPGVVAFGQTLRQCEDLLRSTLEDWVWLGLKLGHDLPVVAGIDLNREPAREPLDAV
jgi:predicted RNase H-like HicB family nuclease